MKFTTNNKVVIIPHFEYFEIENDDKSTAKKQKHFGEWISGAPIRRTVRRRMSFVVLANIELQARIKFWFEEPENLIGPSEDIANHLLKSFPTVEILHGLDVDAPSYINQEKEERCLAP